MVKRFHDTEIWKQDWFIEMEPEYRTFWLYIKDACDHAGVWKPEKRFVEFLIGKPVDLGKALERFNAGKERVRVLKNGRWFLCDFIVFQYGQNLNAHNRLHASILDLLEKNEVKHSLSLTSSRPQLEVKHRPKDKDKDKDTAVTSTDVDVTIHSFSDVKDPEKETPRDAHTRRETRAKRFVKPTPQEVTAYAESIAFRLDGQHFWDWYEARGWMAGKSPMVNWQAAVRTWKTKDGGSDAPNGGKSFVDYAAIARAKRAAAGARDESSAGALSPRRGNSGDVQDATDGVSAGKHRNAGPDVA